MKITAYLIVLLCMVQAAFSLGISPANINIFNDNQSHSFEFTVVNNEHKDYVLALYVESEFEDSISIETRLLEIKSADYETKFKVDVKPLNNLKPGKNQIKLYLQEALPESKALTATLRLGTSINIIVPYPEKYIESAFTVTPLQDNIYMKTLVTNLGSEDINELYSDFTLSDGNAEIKSKTKKVPVERKGSESLDIIMDTSTLYPGYYQATADIFYDDNHMKQENQVKLGNLDFKIISYNKYYIINKINQFTVELEPIWNVDFDMYMDMIFFKDNKEVKKLRTESFHLIPNKNQNITTYWDTKGMDVGEYEVTLIFHMDDEIVSKSINIAVVTPELFRQLSKPNYTIYYIFASLVFIFILTLAYQYYLLKTARRRKNINKRR